jgi:formylglycine-generating enzyme required for sulfatase activity
MIPRLCRVPAGEFIMGREPEQAFTQESPPRKVYLDEFFIDETPVTCAQYEIFVDWITETHDHSRCHPQEPPAKDHRPYIGNPDLYGQRDQPVTGIDWFDMYAFAAWAGMRLPTEAEWEKAARGTDGRRWPWGNESGLQDGKLQALYDDTYYYTPHSRLAGVYDHPDGVSPYGCLDMAGNVWEVCADSFDELWYQRMPKSNPHNTQSASMVVMRGGCWQYNEHDAMCTIRAGIRRDVSYPKPIIGFRCASDVPNPCGAIGPMRHPKPQGVLEPPDGDWVHITHSNGEVYFDGDDVSPSGLFLGIGQPASLNDFLLLYWSAPPIDWMRQFTEVDLRAEMRTTNDVALVSEIDEWARRFQATASEGLAETIRSLLGSQLDPLQKAAGVEVPIRIQPRPLTSLNGDVTIGENGEYVIGVHAGLVTVHDRLGRALVLLLSDHKDYDFLQLRTALTELRSYVQSGGASEVLPQIPSSGSWLSEHTYSHILSRDMTNLVLSHELGHIKLNHLEDIGPLSRKQNRKREYAADRFGLKLALNSDDSKRWEKGFAMALGFWCEFICSCEESYHGSGAHPPMTKRTRKLRKLLPPQLREDFDYGCKALRQSMK